MSKVVDFQKAGAECSIFLADWHTWLNDKLGGDLETIKQIAVNYFKEGLKASIEANGGDQEKVKFVLGSDLYHNNDEYWRTFVDVSKHTSLARIQRSTTIMGRQEGESIDFAKLVYPPMQVADIFSQGINLAHAGLDQRKAHVIARDVALKLRFGALKSQKGNNVKPVAVHHHLILGLQKPPIWPVHEDKLQELWSSMKMSKSIPNSAVFVHDSEKEIESKLQKAFCPEAETKFNPVLDWARSIVFSRDKASLLVERQAKFGGNIEFNSYPELESAFDQGKLHPMDLKKAVAREVSQILEPCRKHFEKPKQKKMLEEMEKLL